MMWLSGIMGITNSNRDSESFSHLRFHLRLSDSKSPQVSSTVRSILANLTNAIAWIVSTRSIISKSSGPFSISLVILVQRSNYNWYNRHFHLSQCFDSLSKSRYLSLFSLSFNFTVWSIGTIKSTVLHALFFFFCWFLKYLFVGMRTGDPSLYQNHREVNVSHSPGQILGCAYTICLYGQSSITRKIPCGSPCPPKRVLSYTLFCVSLLYSLIIFFIVSPLSPHNLHLLFWWVLSFLFSDVTGSYSVVLYCR